LISLLVTNIHGEPSQKFSTTTRGKLDAAAEIPVDTEGKKFMFPLITACGWIVVRIWMYSASSADFFKNPFSWAT
jgi:hypothetical protein